MDAGGVDEGLDALITQLIFWAQVLSQVDEQLAPEHFIPMHVANILHLRLNYRGSHLQSKFLDADSLHWLWRALLTQLMLSRIVWELDHEQLPALHAAADAVGSGNVGALILGFLQDTDHLRVGVIGEVHCGSRLSGKKKAFHAVRGLYILLCCQEKHSTSYQLWTMCF